MRLQRETPNLDSELEWRMPSGEDLVGFALAIGVTDEEKTAPAGEDPAAPVEALWTGGS